MRAYSLFKENRTSVALIGGWRAVSLAAGFPFGGSEEKTHAGPARKQARPQGTLADVFDTEQQPIKGRHLFFSFCSLLCLFKDFFVLFRSLPFLLSNGEGATLSASVGNPLFANGIGDGGGHVRWDGHAHHVAGEIRRLCFPIVRKRRNDLHLGYSKVSANVPVI